MTALPGSDGSPPTDPVRVPLLNDRWGFTTNCFVCERTNDAGLRVPYFHEPDAGIVTADFVLDGRFSGAPTWVHGGVSLAILDEAMAWAAIAVQGRWAVTKSSTAAFDRPVIVGRSYRVVARITAPHVEEPELLEASAEITSTESGRVCVRATAVMSVVTVVQAPGLGLGELTEEEQTYLRGGR